MSPFSGTYDVPINYDIMQDEICKVEGTIESISRNFHDTCGFDFHIKVGHGTDAYILSGREVFFGQGVPLCL